MRLIYRFFNLLALFSVLAECSKSTTGSASTGSDDKAASNNTGIVQWARTISTGPDSSNFNAIATDSSGNVYAAGYQIGTGVYMYGAESITGTNTGTNATLVKYDSSGSVQWARTVAAGASASAFNAVFIDNSGNVYAAGYQQGNGAYTYGAQSATGTAANFNIVLVKYDATGTAQWARTVSAGSNLSQFNAVTTDSSGNVYAAGYQNGVGAYTYGAHSATGTHSGNNVLLVKYDSSGTAQWARTVSTGSGHSRFNGVAVDSSGNVYAAGYQSGISTFTYGGQTVTSTYASAQNIVLVKYDSAGAAQWARTVSTGASASAFNGVNVDTLGNVYAAGSQSGTSTFTYGTQTATGPTSTNVLLVKYDTLGTAQWARTHTTGVNNAQFNAVMFDNSGYIYAAGLQTGTGTYTYGTQSVTGTATGANVLLLKYDSTGTALWAKSVSTGSIHSQYNGVMTDSLGNVYAVGRQFGNGVYTYGGVQVTGTSTNDNIAIVKFYQ